MPDIIEQTDKRLILAVSGGADSVVMLHLLAQQSDVKMIVAHFDHGLREDSADDEQFVRGLAEKYGLEYESERGNLSNNSEATARAARHGFLSRMADKHNATITTAHHQDDIFETAAMNIIRGTGIDGVVNMLAPGPIYRPLTRWNRQQIVDYAVLNNLEWIQDSTNSDMRYTRNRFRAKLQEITPDNRIKLWSTLTKLADLRQEQTILLHDLSHWVTDSIAEDGYKVNIDRFALLPFEVRTATLHHLLRKRQAIGNVGRNQLTELAMFACRASHGKMYKLNQSVSAQVDNRHLLLTARRSPWRTPIKRKPTVT